ncbi:MAG: hypothetical protein U9M90_03960 [Patescibacteria group bacterium]|nr:hypothetical protein [Patescibacteria group bacterium]
MKRSIVHPFLFSAIPIMSLYYQNADQAKLSFMIPPLLVILAVIAFFFVLLKLFTKNTHRSAAILSVLIILFFSFGSCLNFNIVTAILGKEIQFFQIYLTLWILFFFLSLFIIIKVIKSHKNLTFVLNTISAVTFLMLVAQIIFFHITHPALIAQEQESSSIPQSEEFPDVYYIILDGYARADIMKDFFGYDNSNFISFLEEKDFFVAKDSHSNYPRTYYSMPSSLNYEYVNFLEKYYDEDLQDLSPLNELVQKNRVQKKFKEKGYTIVNIQSDWEIANSIPYDIILGDSHSFNEFDDKLIDMTPLKLCFLKKAIINSKRKKIQNAFDYIPEISKISEPTFSYIHIVSPHPPFIFDEHGNPTDPSALTLLLDGCAYLKIEPDRNDFAKKYGEQAHFITEKIKDVITLILQNSESDPIIIIQSDHGSRSSCDSKNPFKTDLNEQFSILNAYHLPDSGKEMLYDSITPVNTFRIIFNILFKEKRNLLPDKIFFVSDELPYKFIEVTNKL